MKKLNKELLGNRIDFDGVQYEIVNINTKDKSYSIINHDGSKADYLKPDQINEYSNIQEVNEGDHWYFGQTKTLEKGKTYKMRGSDGNEIIKVTSVRESAYSVDVIDLSQDTAFSWSLDKNNAILYTEVELPEHKVLPTSRKVKEVKSEE